MCGCLCRPGAEPDPRQRDGRAGAVCGGYSGHRLLGGPDLRDPAGGHGSDPWGGPHRICTLLCALLKNPRRVIVCEKDPARRAFVREHYPQALLCGPEECERFVGENSPHGGADVVLEAAGGKDTFALAWKCARPNGLVTVVALYDEAQTLPLPQMYGKNLTFKTGGVDGCDCGEILG